MAHDAHDRHDRGDHAGHRHGRSGHAHGHVPARFGGRFAVGVALNAGFVLIEAVSGVASHSVALLADAGHNLSDALGLGVAWAAAVLTRRRPAGRFTYGLGGSSILAALFNAVFLLVVVGGLTWEAVLRLAQRQPEPVGGGTVMAVAACGIVLNGFCAWLFAAGSGDLNERGAFVHMAADALVSLGVVAAGLAILLTGWLWIDPVMSIAVNIVIVVGTWSLLTGSLAMSLNAAPPGVDLAAVRGFLLRLPGVAALHDLHVWSLSTTETALTCHLVTPDGHPGDEVLLQASDGLRERFGIAHVTLQPERTASAAHLAAQH